MRVLNGITLTTVHRAKAFFRSIRTIVAAAFARLRGMRAPEQQQPNQPREWVVMLPARSSIRLLDDKRVLINAGPESTVPLTAIRLRNGFYKDGDKLVFKGLIAEARGTASDAEHAFAFLAMHAASYLHVAAVAGNGAVDEPKHLLWYAPPADGQVGEFVEQVPVDTRMPAPTVRSVDPEQLIALLGTLIGHRDEGRLHRAMEHYQHALAALDPLNRVMTAQHLYMSCENLGQVIFRRMCREAGLPNTGESKHELAVAAGFQPVGESRQHLWDYDSYLRVTHIFGGDATLYKKLRKTSDGFEHGFANFGDVQKQAHASADPAMVLIRRAILRETGLPDESPLLAEKYDHPLAGWSPTLILKGTYSGDPDPEWPYFYGASLIPEIVAIEDLDGDQKRNVTYRANGSGASLINGQSFDTTSWSWPAPTTPGHNMERIGEPEITVIRQSDTETVPESDDA